MRALKSDLTAFPRAHKSAAAFFVHVIDLRRLDTLSLQCMGEPLAQGMAAALREPQRDAARLRIKRGDIGPRRADGERTGLVEQRDIDFSEPLKRIAILDQEAALDQCARSRDLCCRNRQAHCARAGDDQHCDRDDQRMVPSRARQHPSHEGKCSEAVDGGRIEPRGAIRDAYILAARLPRFVHQPRDFSNGGIFRNGGQAHLDRLEQVDGPGMDGAADSYRVRCALAGEHCVVDRAAARFDNTVSCERLAGGNQYQHAFFQLVRRDALSRSVFPHDACALAHPAEQRANPRARAGTHRSIERPPTQKEEQQHHSAFEVGMSAASHGLVNAEACRQQYPDRDRHIHVGAAKLQRHPRRGEERAARIGNHRQGDEAGKPVEHLARRARRSCPDAH